MERRREEGGAGWGHTHIHIHLGTRPGGGGGTKGAGKSNRRNIVEMISVSWGGTLPCVQLKSALTILLRNTTISGVANGSIPALFDLRHW